MHFNVVLSLFFYLLFSLSLSAQTATVFIDVDGTNPSTILCTPATQNMQGDEDMNGNLDCASINGFFSRMEYTFQDPIPLGNLISSIEVIIHNASGVANFDVIVGQGTISGFQVNKPGQIGVVDCPNSDVRASQNFDPMINFGYQYDGLNNFDIIITDNMQTVCFSHAEIIFTYVPENEIPTMGQWGLFILGLLLSNMAVIKLRSFQLRSTSNLMVDAE